MYRGASDSGVIARVKAAVSIPVIGNGDIKSGEDALRMFAETNCDSVMIARAAEGNPWIFAQVKSVLQGNGSLALPSAQERIAMARTHARLLSQREGRNICRMRKHAMWYMAGLPGASAARARINLCTTFEDFNEVFDELLEKTKQHQMMQASKEGALI